MNAIPWSAVVTEDGKLIPDERRAFRAYVSQWKGDAVEIVVRPKPRRQSAAKRGFYHSVFKVEFRKWLAEKFREHYGDFTLDAAHELLVRLVLNLPEDVERASTAIDAMNDDEYEDFLFRAEGFLSRIGVDIPDAERDPVRRLERAS